MLGLILIYFIGKAFYDLAQLHEKNKWGFAILGVVAYYLGTFVAGILIGVIIELRLIDAFADLPDMAVSFIALPFGLLASWGLYKFLKAQWRRPEKYMDEEILDSDILNPNS